MPPNAVIIVDREAFTESNLKRAGYITNPLTDHSLDKFQVIEVDVTNLTSLADSRAGAEQSRGVPMPQHVRARDAFVALSAADRKHAPVSREPLQEDARDARGEYQALKAGYNYGDTTEMFASSYEVPAARIKPGLYRNITGNSATAMGFVAAASIGPSAVPGLVSDHAASDILHELAGFKNYPVYTFQAEDEIAGVCAAIGASFGGSIAITYDLGPRHESRRPRRLASR